MPLILIDYTHEQFFACCTQASDDGPGLHEAETYAENAWLRAAEYDPEADAFEQYEISLGKVLR